jgi:hypothetical protein
MLCGEDELDKERRGYASAFRRVADLHFVPAGDDWRDRIPPGGPHFFINPDGRPWLPEGIESVKGPTAVFHIDTYVVPERRMRWSEMYDYAFVFHPRCDTLFRERGIPGARLLPHAAERDLFGDPKGTRTFDVGWVGRGGRSIYGTRDAVLRQLSGRFRMNDVSRFYSPEEMAEIYCSSRIVVNVGRDDYPQDANMRCFEVMASGALLITRSPTELTDLGFEENVHFAAYRDSAEVGDIVQSWLDRKDERCAVAERARELILREHTYDARVRTIFHEMESGTANANARTWPAWRVAARRLDYFVEYGEGSRALDAFGQLAAASPLHAAQQSWRLGRLAAKKAKRLLQR